MNYPWYKKLMLIVLAPVIIGAWCVMNPKAVWKEAKKEWKL